MPHAVQTAVPSATADAPLPQHIAIIMDGNNRWAKEHRAPRLKGHHAGAESLRTLLESCRERPFIRYITLYAFSTENWKRSADEVSDLMNLLRHYVKREANTLHDQGVRMQFIGQREDLPDDIRTNLEAVETLTKTNNNLLLTVALSYGARQEITHAMRRIAEKITRGALIADAIDETTIAAHLYTASLPDPDLLIRTGGDERLSNFLLWQSAYTELYFTETLWPDFTPEHLDEAIRAYQKRERRFGSRNDA